MIPVVPVLCLYILYSPVLFCSPGRSQKQPIFSASQLHKTVLPLLSDTMWTWARHPAVLLSSCPLQGVFRLQPLVPCHLAWLEATRRESETVQATTL